MMQIILLFFLPLLLISSCQELPKEYRGKEGGKKLERYRHQVLKGVVRVDKKLRSKLPKGDYFLIISVKNLKEPMPVAVLRVKDPSFPFDFTITGKHKLRSDRLIEGELIINARVSKTPVAEAQKGDLVGGTTAKAGDKDIVIVIDTEVP